MYWEAIWASYYPGTLGFGVWFWMLWWYPREAGLWPRCFDSVEIQGASRNGSSTLPFAGYRMLRTLGLPEGRE